MIRYADTHESRQFFALRNLPEALVLSRSQRAVSWGEHQDWFGEAIKRKNVLLFSIGQNVGMVRCDRGDLEVTVSIYLKPKYRHKGIGAKAVNLAMRECNQKWLVEKFVAYAREDNAASLAFFRKLGFVRTGTEDGIVRMESL